LEGFFVYKLIFKIILLYFSSKQLPLLKEYI
jgi:hypothetical protein